jgi:hypothetical protein
MSCSYNQNHVPTRLAEYVKGLPVYRGTAARQVAREHDGFWQHEISQGLRDYKDECCEDHQSSDSDANSPRLWTSQSAQWLVPLTVTSQPAPGRAPLPARHNVQKPRQRRRCHTSYNPDYKWSSFYGASKPKDS